MTPDIRKSGPDDLAVLGGMALYDKPISTSNLVRPDFEKFLAYSRIFHDAHRYTNDGPVVKMLERRLAQFHGTNHCIAYANGFWALVLSIKCLALPGRREVVMPSLTYRRLADIVAWCGLVPRFCEVDETSLAMTAELTAPCVGPATALILGVHPIVNCCDAAGLERLAADHGVPLLFDAVESVYETVGGRKTGTFGAAECFSMHASKLVNGFEGGYITTDDTDLAHKLAKMRAFGYFGQDNIENLGINAKLNEIHAAMALASLDDLEDQVVRNQARYRRYQAALAGLEGIRLLAFDESERCSFKTIVVEVTEAWPLTREQTVELLNRERVLSRAYYSPPLHTKKTQYETIVGALPVTERLADRYMLMPCGHHVTEDDIDAVTALLRFVREHANDILERLPS